MNHPTTTSGITYAGSLNGKTPDFTCDTGEIFSMTSKELATLKGLSIQRLVLQPFAARVPYWYTNANTLAYCLVCLYF
jgi:oxalate decarboxylase